MSAEPAAPLVVVFGAGGFIGRHVVAALRARGWRVRAFVHVVEPVPFRPDPHLEVQRGDIRVLADVQRAMTRCTAAVNAAGAKRDEPSSEAVNVGGARNLAAAARTAGVAALVQISTQAVKIARKGLYAQTKLAADEVLLAAGLPVTILRPSVVYGSGESGVFSTLQRLVRRLPVVPVLGDGRWLCAPVQVDDVAQAVAECLHRPATRGRVYDLGGPDHLSLDELLDRIGHSEGRRVRKLHLPAGLSLGVARLLAVIWPGGPVTVSNVLGSTQPIPLDPEPARRDFGFAPMTLAEGLRRSAAIDRDHEVPAEEDLRGEAEQFARYLLGVRPATGTAEAYASAVRSGQFGGSDATVRLARRRPWLLPVLDAVETGRPGSVLQRRLLLMAALLETGPEHAEWYVGRRGCGRVLAALAWHTVVGGIKRGVGAVISIRQRLT